MSGGPAAIRGYLVQTLVAVLGTLDTDKDWLRVTLEPDHVSQKIDILWQYQDTTKAVQVRSSQKQISKATAERWAEEFQVAHADADELELVLVGPCSQGVVDLEKVGHVVVPPALNLDLTAFKHQAAHLLDRLLVGQGKSMCGPDYREMLAGALVEKLAVFSTSSHAMTREELVALLKIWIADAPKVEIIGNASTADDLLARAATVFDWAGRISAHYQIGDSWANTTAALEAMFSTLDGLLADMKQGPPSALADVFFWLQKAKYVHDVLQYPNLDRQFYHDPTFPPWGEIAAKGGQAVQDAKARLHIHGSAKPGATSAATKNAVKRFGNWLIGRK
ncbi:MAG: hypothetical protein ACLP9L_01430 [Thermoguttaceae bacterium]